MKEFGERSSTPLRNCDRFHSSLLLFFVKLFRFSLSTPICRYRLIQTSFNIRKVIGNFTSSLFRYNRCFTENTIKLPFAISKDRPFHSLCIPHRFNCRLCSLFRFTCLLPSEILYESNLIPVRSFTCRFFLSFRAFYFTFTLTRSTLLRICQSFYPILKSLQIFKNLCKTGLRLVIRINRYRYISHNTISLVRSRAIHCPFLTCGC